MFATTCRAVSYKSSPDATGLMTGCPETGCHGYELMSDLDFTDTTARRYREAWDPVVQGAKPAPGAGWIPHWLQGEFVPTFLLYF